MTTTPKPYKDTLNLPVTRFDMKANLATREPQIQARWREEGLYEKVRQARAGRERRVLHDGPPYANGEIHMGHLLNKVLKDLVVRSLTMRGYDSPYVPGWDCHGLPIEHKVAKDLGSRAAAMDHAEIRDLCRVEALKWVGIQRDQFRRLGVSGDWDNPYLTLDPRYEAGILDVLADLVEGGYVFRQLKPIHWCTQDRTALAEAELEYHDETSPSVYVNFPIIAGLPESFGEGPWHAMIWTTTPWTLPANVAIAAHPDLEYVGVHYSHPADGREVRAIAAASLASKVMGMAGVNEFAEVARCRGRDLEHVTYRHVFLDRTGPIVLAPYVGADDGTGLVHTAPGHGGEDYRTGQQYGLPTLSPVDAQGRYTDEAPAEWVGKTVWQANPLVVERLKADGTLVHQAPLTHSYPHCWRCKKPVIFRATEQWFVAVDHDDLRSRTLHIIGKDVGWTPDWGESRIGAMVGSRPDWCISRQRSWGVPIPAFGCNSCGYQVLTAESIRHVRDRFRAEGADAWYRRPAEELIPPGSACPKCDGTSFSKGMDILDVWFESGSSHRAVLDEPSYGLGGSPAALYLEGSDQHRGWFQSSLLTSVMTRGRAPFLGVLTHGFIVDQDGKKMSKSGGNALSAVKATEQYGADVLRLYVAGLDYADDVRMSERGIKEASESYRKVRNTLRYLLGNLEDFRDFDPSTVDPATLHEVDRWALGQLNALIRDVTAAHETYEFYRATQRIHQFCAIDLSSFYLDVLKDRLYAETPEGPDRRAAQFVLARLLDVLVRLVAPVMPHTAEEVWGLLPRAGRASSVHLADWPTPDPSWDDHERDRRWESLRQIRENVFACLEPMRKNKEIGSSQEATVELTPSYRNESRFLIENQVQLLTICMVSAVEIQPPTSESESPDSSNLAQFGGATAERSSYAKCERCWNLRPTVGENPDYPTLCDRCARVIAERAS